MDTDLSASSPVSASPENKKTPSWSETDHRRETDLPGFFLALELETGTNRFLVNARVENRHVPFFPSCPRRVRNWKQACPFFPSCPRRVRFFSELPAWFRVKFRAEAGPSAVGGRIPHCGQLYQAIFLYQATSLRQPEKNLIRNAPRFSPDAQPIRKLCRGRARNLLVKQLARLPLTLSR